MSVVQSSQRAVINWNTFNVGSAASVNFVQPNAQAVTLNRVSDSNPSQIFGRITSNGQVVLTNANGIYFAPGSSVDVGAFTATTHSITDDNFMAGKYVFDRNGSTAKVVNEGHISAALSGYVALLAPEVQNAGVVVARAGTVAMAAGELITLNIDGVGSLAGITTTPSTIATLIENKQAVQAPDGQIILSAIALNKLQAGVIKNSGSLEANSLVSKGGKIVLEGDDITLDRNSKIEAKGPTGGGTVLVGGDWQGSGDLRQATKVMMTAGASIDASAADNGDGGKVVLWSDVHNADSVTQAHGSIKAEAGPNGGNGGQVETSGHLLNVDNIQVSTESPKGNAGTWLLDPYNITITTSATGTAFTDTPASDDSYTAALTSNIKAADINLALGNGNVTISTGSAGTDTGNITVSSALSWTSNKTLTLSAANQILGSGNIAIGTGGNLTFDQAGTSSFSSRYSGTISGNGSFTKTGAGVVYGWSSHTYTGLTRIDTGSLDLGSSGVTNLTGGFEVNNSGILNAYQALNSVLGNVAVNNSSQFIVQNVTVKRLTGAGTIMATTGGGAKTVTLGGDNSDSTFTGTFASGATGGLQFIKNGTGKFTFTGSMSIGAGGFYGYIVNGGEVVIGDGSTNFSTTWSSATITLANNATFTLNSTGASTFASSVSGVGNLKIAGGNWTIDTVRSYLPNASTPDAVGLDLAAGTSLSTGNDVNSRYVSSLTGTGSLGLNMTNSLAKFFVGSGNSSSTFDGVISGVGALSKTGTGTFTLTGNNTNSGAIAVTAGVLRAASDTALGSNSGAVSVSSGATLELGGLSAGLASPNGIAIGAKALTIADGGAIHNVAGYNTYAGNLTLSGSSTITVDTGTRLNFTATGSPITIAGNKALILKLENGDLTFAKALSGSSGSKYVKVGTGTLTTGGISGLTLATGVYARLYDPTGNDYSTTYGDTPDFTYGFYDATVGGNLVTPAATVGTATWTGTKPVATSPAGTYTLTYASGLTINDASYVLLGAGAATNWTVNRRPLTLTATKTYNGNNAFSTVSLSGFYGTQTLNYSGASAVSAHVADNGSNYISAITLANGTNGGLTTNYSLTYSYATTPVTINAVSLTPTLTNTGVSKVYDGSLNMPAGFVPAATFTGFLAGDTAATLTASGGSYNDKNVSGATSLTVNGLSLTGITGTVGSLAGDYSLSTSSASIVASITARTVAISATKTYDSLNTLANAQVTVSTGVAGESFTVSGATANSSQVADNGANYISAVTLVNGTGTSASNYTLPALSHSVNNSVTVNAATANVNATKTYSGDTALTSGQVSITGVNGETLGFTGAATTSDANVSTNNKYVNTSSMTLADGSTGLASNYILPTSAYNATSNTASINRLALTLTPLTDIGSASSTYGSSLTAGSVSFANKVTGDDVSAVVSITEPVDSRSAGGKLKAGNYYQSASTSLTGAQAGNYSFAGVTSSTANYTVDRLALTGAAVAAGSSTYGNSPASGAVTFDNAVTGDAVSGAATVNTSTRSQSGYAVVGTYTQTAGTTLSGTDAGNYSFAGFTSAVNYTINPKPLVVSVPGATKVYDGSNTIHLTGAASILGAINTDDVQISSGNVTGFVDKNVGTNKAVTYTGFALSGNDAGNYSLPLNPSSTADITPKAITATGIAATNKVYDATTSASLSFGAATLTGGALNTTDNKYYTGDTVTLTTTSATGSFANADAGHTKPVTITGLTLGGADAGNYTISDASAASANITAKTLTVTGLSAPTSRVYDRTLSADISGTPSLLTAQAAGTGNSTDGKPYAGDVIGFTGTASGSYNSKDVATANTVTFAGLASSNSNYTLDLGSQAASITRADLSMSGVSVQNKTYDTNRAAVLGGTPTVAALSGDAVTVDASSATGLFADKNVGAGKTVTASGYAISGADANNYNLLQPSGLSAEITKADLWVTGVTAQNKVYDASTTATLSGSASITALAGDSVNLGGSASGGFANKNVGTGKAVTVSGYSLSGSDANNYTLHQPTGVSADITAATLTLSGITASDKIYDGNTNATVSVTNVVKSGLFAGDEVNVVATGAFSDKNVGAGKTVSLASTYSGADASNYNITNQSTTLAEISAKALGLSIPGASRLYDGTTNISPLGPIALLGVVGTDQVALGNGTVTGYVDKNVGANKTVTYNGLVLSGVDMGNYTLPAQPTSDANITPAPLTISGITAASKTYDATTSATVNAAQLIKAGLIGNDVVDISVTGTFADKNAGNGKIVNLVSTYTGNDVGNYTITDQATTTANIQKASLTVTADNANKLFGNANPAFTASLSGFVGGETLATSGVTGAASVSTAALLNADPGTAVITPTQGSLSANNYDFTRFVDGQLTIRAISALGNDQVSALIGSQLASLSATQIGSFTGSQLQVFSVQQISSLSMSQVSGLTSAQIGSLSNAQLQALSATQVAALTPDQLTALTPAQIGFLTTASILSEAQVLSLTPTQIAGIAPSHFASMSAAELGSFSNEQLQALSALQIASIAPGNFASFTPEQIMALSIVQVQNLTPEQLATFSPIQVASISAAELAYFDARQLAAIGIYPKTEVPSPVAEPVVAEKENVKPFEAAIPVMTEVAAAIALPSAAVSPSTIASTPAAPAIAKPEVSAALSPRALQGMLFAPNTESSASTGVLPITILNSAQAKPTTAGIAFEQDADSVSLRLASAPAVPPMSAKLVFSDKLTTFMVASPNGEMVAFEGSLLNNRMVIVAPSLVAKRLARVDMNLVLAAAVTSLGKTNRVMLAELKGVLLDLR